MQKSLTTLDGRLKATVDYISKKRFFNRITKCRYIFDGLYRFILQFNDDEQLAKCIGKFSLDPNCEKRYNEIVDRYSLGFIDENCRLRLIQAVYLETKYQISSKKLKNKQ